MLAVVRLRYDARTIDYMQRRPASMRAMSAGDGHTHLLGSIDDGDGCEPSSSDSPATTQNRLAVVPKGSTYSSSTSLRRSTKSATWRKWSLAAESARHTMQYRFASTQDREEVIRPVRSGSGLSWPGPGPVPDDRMTPLSVPSHSAKLSLVCAQGC